MLVYTVKVYLLKSAIFFKIREKLFLDIFKIGTCINNIGLFTLLLSTVDQYK